MSHVHSSWDDCSTMMRKRKNFGAYAANTNVGDKLGLRPGNQDAEQVFERLCETQSVAGQIGEDAIERITSQTRTCKSRVRAVGSFYSLLDTVDPSDKSQPIVRVCDGPACCLRGGNELLKQAKDSPEECRVERTSCLGYCDHAPTMMVDQPDGQRTLVANATWPLDLADLVDADATEFRLLGHASPDISRRPLSKRFCVADPKSIDAALSAGAYLALNQSLEMDPAEIIREVDASGLRGRGGAGFRCGQKWRIAAETPAEQRYVICNADESEPGTFKDRVLMEQDPHSVLEGMAICARVIGATKGVIYIRGEYRNAYEILSRAIEQARDSGFLGEDIQGRGFDFDISIHRGAGAYICGEETALLESLEGKRGEPRERPPFPATVGLWGKPTIVNNVETLSSVPSIIHDGAAHYRSLGRSDACGTKLYCLSGHVEQTGICEAPKGVSTRQLISDFGHGLRDGSDFKFALTGGAAGTFVPEELLDVPLSYDAMSDGVALGSGAIIVADQSVSAAEMLLWVLNFFANESCGKCTPCRVGTVQALEIVQRIVGGDGQDDDVDRLLKLAKTLGSMSLCGLGLSVQWPIESAIKYFREDFNV